MEKNVLLFWLIPLILVLITLTASFICFMTVFYSSRKPSTEEFPLPVGKQYEEFYPRMREWMKEFRTLPQTPVEITSFDGLKLRGRYFQHKAGGPIEILFHGYRGTSYRDLCGAVYRCFTLGRNALVLDHRAAGESEGHVITFGVREKRDCLDWIKYTVEHIDPDAKIIITGISMGAATVLMAASEDLPKNVVGCLSDCGFSSAEAIIRKTIADMSLPAPILYPFVRLGAIIFGRFDPNKSSPVTALRSCKIPVMFIHGDADYFVPYRMSEENFAACASEKKKLVLTRDAGHGLCFPKNEEEYFRENAAFFDPILKK